MRIKYPSVCLSVCLSLFVAVLQLFCVLVENVESDV